MRKIRESIVVRYALVNELPCQCEAEVVDQNEEGRLQHVRND